MRKTLAYEILARFTKKYARATNYLHRLYSINKTYALNYLLQSLWKEWWNYKKVVKFLHIMAPWANPGPQDLKYVRMLLKRYKNGVYFDESIFNFYTKQGNIRIVEKKSEEKLFGKEAKSP